MAAELTEFELGWLVGLIQGEGSIYWHRNLHGGFDSFVIVVTNTECSLLKRILALTGAGRIYRQPGNNGSNLPGGPYRPLYRWRISGHSAAALLEVVEPHLFGRAKERASAALAIWRQTHP